MLPKAEKVSCSALLSMDLSRFCARETVAASGHCFEEGAAPRGHATRENCQCTQHESGEMGGGGRGMGFRAAPAIDRNSNCFNITA